MTWQIDNIQKTRTKTTWQAGDYVVITVVNDADPDDVLTKEFCYTFNGDQTKAEFRSMVRTEILAHLAQMNSVEVFHDVTDALSP